MKLKKKLSVIMAALMVSSMFMSGCNNSKMANVDKNSREQKLEATMKNLKNRKEKITTDKAALMTTDYEDITGFKGVTLDGSEYSAKDLAKKDMTIAYVWYPS